MSKTNIQIVQEYIEALNKKQFERTFDYCSQDCIIHSAPFVGVGIVGFDSTDGKVKLGKMVSNAPASECLREGDELIEVSDANHTWSSIEDLKAVRWTYGAVGTPLTFTVRRDGKMLECHLTRRLIDGFTFKLADTMKSYKVYSETWPVLEEQIHQIFGSEDWVAVYSTLHGTNRDYRYSAAWSSCSVYRLKEGKIIEMMGVEDECTQIKQLGYQIHEPQREIAL
jgi:hypothetical protein